MILNDVVAMSGNEIFWTMLGYLIMAGLMASITIGIVSWSGCFKTKKETPLLPAPKPRLPEKASQQNGFYPTDPDAPRMLTEEDRIALREQNARMEEERKERMRLAEEFTAEQKKAKEEEKRILKRRKEEEKAIKDLFYMLSSADEKDKTKEMYLQLIKTLVDHDKVDKIESIDRREGTNAFISCKGFVVVISYKDEFAADTLTISNDNGYSQVKLRFSDNMIVSFSFADQYDHKGNSSLALDEIYKSKTYERYKKSEEDRIYQERLAEEQKREDFKNKFHSLLKDIEGTNDN